MPEHETWPAKRYVCERLGSVLQVAVVLPRPCAARPNPKCSRAVVHHRLDVGKIE